MPTSPPRPDACPPRNTDLPVRAANQGAITQWAEPVTGSSSMPAAGAKVRHTESSSVDGSAVVSATTMA